MPSSTKEYFAALRAGDYLTFLNWPVFVGRHYLEKLDDKRPSKESINGDQLIDLLIFDWLNNGFSREDLWHLACLNKISLTVPIEGRLAYLQTSIKVALTFCLGIHTYGLEHHYINPEKMTRDAISQLMIKRDLELRKFKAPESVKLKVIKSKGVEYRPEDLQLEFSDWQVVVEAERLDFEACSETIDRDVAQKAVLTIKGLIKARECITSYIDYLELLIEKVWEMVNIEKVNISVKAISEFSVFLGAKKQEQQKMMEHFPGVELDIETEEIILSNGVIRLLERKFIEHWMASLCVYAEHLRHLLVNAWGLKGALENGPMGEALVISLKDFKKATHWKECLEEMMLLHQLDTSGKEILDQIPGKSKPHRRNWSDFFNRKGAKVVPASKELLKSDHSHSSVSTG